MLVAMPAPQPPTINTVDALWTLIQAQPRRVRRELSARLSEDAVASRQAYVRDSLRTAVKEVKEAKKNGQSFQSVDDFLKEFA